ncbi:MAG: hypothetical protein J6V41_04665 [Kiritimatiellae bacterium]|nr:hypothetical protein [Kiritimatiellia bacterium]
MKLEKCPDCDRPVSPYTFCPWCNTFVSSNSVPLKVLLPIALFAVLFFILSCFIPIGPVENVFLSIVLGAVLGFIVGLLEKTSPSYICFIPMTVVSLAIVDEYFFRVICIHTPWVLFLAVFSFFLSSARNNIQPFDSIVKRIILSMLLWLPMLLMAFFYVSAQGALLIPAIIFSFIYLLLVFPCKTNAISIIAIAVLTGFAIIYCNLYAYWCGFILAFIFKLFLSNRKQKISSNSIA